MKRLKRFFNKKFKRYSFVFLTLITCVIVFSTSVSAAPFFSSNLDPYKIYSKKNIDSVFFAHENDTFCYFSEGTGSSLNASVPCKFQYTDSFFFMANPFVISVRNVQSGSAFRYRKFSLKLPTYFGWRLINSMNTDYNSDIIDDKSYALSFHMVFLASTNNADWAQYSFRPTDDFEFVLNFRKNYNDSTLTSYKLNYKFTEVGRDNGTDLYGYYDFYCELPGSVIKGIDSITINGYSDIAGSAQLQFGFPAPNTGYSNLFEIVPYDPYGAPVYTSPFTDSFETYEESEKYLKDGIIRNSFSEINLNLSRFRFSVNEHLQSFKGVTAFVNKMFAMSPFSIIVSFVSLGCVFLVIFRRS